MTPWGKKMAERQAAGLCRCCERPHAPGSVLCALHQKRERARCRAKCAQKKAEGLCIVSGCDRRAEGGFIRCGPCHKQYTDYIRAYKRVSRAKGRHEVRQKKAGRHSAK